MNTNEINRFMSDFQCFKGTYAKNMLPLKHYSKRPLAFILNTDESDKPGTHWVALFIDENNNAEYFDSFGFSPICCKIYELLRINNVKSINYNKYPFQSELTSTCGIYCIIYLKMRCSDLSFQRFVELFSENRLLNDLIVTSLMN